MERAPLTHDLAAGTRYILRARTNTPDVIEVHHANGAVDHVLLPHDGFSKYTFMAMDHPVRIRARDLDIVPALNIPFFGANPEQQALEVLYRSRFAAPLRMGGCIFSRQRPRTKAARQSVVDNRGLDLGSEALSTLGASPMICDPLPALPDGHAIPPSTLRIAVVLHLHYPELWPEFRTTLRHALPAFDLVVTLTAADSGLEATIREDFPEAVIRVVDNLGRDIRPFVQVLQEGLLDGADLVCKLHGKRSVLSGVAGSRFGHLWRRRNLLDLLGSPAQVQHIITTFETRPPVGMMGSAALRLGNGGGPDPGFAAALPVREKLCAMAGVDPRHIEDDYFAGTMFWVRRDALEPLKGMTLGDDMFTSEAMQIGDQFEHGVERFFADCVRGLGYRLADIEPLALTEGALRNRRGRMLAPHSLFLARNDSLATRWAVPLPSIAGKPVALMAATSPDMTLPAHVRHLLKTLKGAGYTTVLCLACPDPDAPSADLGTCADALFLRDIGGFDMALWAAALRHAPALWQAGEILFVTDALIGPLDDGATALEAVRNSRADCFAFLAQEGRRFSRHFFALRGRALAHEAVRAFFDEVLSWAKERESIHRYDKRLPALLEQTCGLSVEMPDEGVALPFLTADMLADARDDPRLVAYLARRGSDPVRLERDIWRKTYTLFVDHGVMSRMAMTHKTRIRRAARGSFAGKFLRGR